MLIAVPTALGGFGGYRIDIVPPPPISEVPHWVVGATPTEMDQLVHYRPALVADWRILAVLGLLDRVGAPLNYDELTDGERLAHMRAWLAHGSAVFADAKPAPRSEAPEQ
jgi:hypothetical protein